ncbi:techylectin-5A-like isoform X1 [Dermacentor variabilis]|uniref:techylectin-5A-like isoform X1 n=1 Tax=Dermacentor variabilis TaxID=34621 RepID=UPI003F5BDE76
MIWSVASLSLVVLCSVSSGSGAKTAAVAPTTLAEAGKRVEKLADLFSDIRGNMRPRHCADLLRAGQTTSGLYDIFIGKNDVKGKVVYCDMDTDGGGWTVIQRRGQFGNRVYYFYRNWKEYAAGFGDPAKEFWFGNNALHALTSNAECMKLKIVLKNHTGESASVDYEGFKVGSEKELFKLSLGRFLGPKGWNSLKPCNNSKFTTLDKDNDGEKYNCAVRYRSGWWHNLCHMANPNGLNLNGAHESYADGIEWSYRNGSYYLYHYSYPSVTIMLRPLTMDASCKSRRPH